MNLGQLKKALSRFPADMDNAEVVVVHANGEQPNYENLAAVAVPASLMVPDGSENVNAVIMMTDSGALRYAKQGKAIRGDGHRYTEQELLDSQRDEQPPEG